MAQLQIYATTTNNVLQLKIQYPPNPQLSYNFKLEIQVFQQKIENGNRRDTLTYKNIFHVQQRLIQIKDLGFSKMYRVQVANQYGGGQGQRKVKNVYVYTQVRREQQQQQQSENLQQNRPHQSVEQRSFRPMSSKPCDKRKKSQNVNRQLCNSELLIKTLAQSGHIVNKDKAHKYMLESRKCRNVREFINEKHGRRINPSEVGDKRMLVIQSKLLFSQIYKYRQDCRFFGNSWGMGPFYSYDFNENQIRKH